LSVSGWLKMGGDNIRTEKKGFGGRGREIYAQKQASEIK
jgi:hypothetical protein